MRAHDEVVAHARLLVPFDHLRMIEEADHLGLDADLLAELAQGRLGQGLARLDEPARQAVAPGHGSAPARREEDAPVPQHGDRGGEERAARKEPVRRVPPQTCWPPLMCSSAPFT